MKKVLILLVCVLLCASLSSAGRINWLVGGKAINYPRMADPYIFEYGAGNDECPEALCVQSDKLWARALKEYYNE